MTDYIAYCLKNVALIALVGFCVWLTGSAWCLIALLFMSYWKADPLVCPHCGKVIKVEEEEELP